MTRFGNQNKIRKPKQDSETKQDSGNKTRFGNQTRFGKQNKILETNKIPGKTQRLPGISIEI